MRCAMAMIELIFAIVIIAISVITIPTMMSVADKASKSMAIDEDVMARLFGWTIDKFQARWDGNYSASGSGALNIDTIADLNCSRAGGYRIGSEENISSMQCNMTAPPSAIPSTGSGILANGIEQLNNGAEPITITSADGTNYNITATYSVAYVDSTVATSGNTQTAIWVLGSSGNMNPSPSGTSHLKRIVTRFNNDTLGVDTTLTFFKSNKGN
ncbi:MAG TPA: hypothetical protein VFX68_06845 [Sulfuricurvum sp.]|nr:hypothetical protein [Sulfuricurvum sp.]